jgi:alpha-L-fucosidase
MRQIGKWLEANSEAIYSTRTAPCYHDSTTWFTLRADGKKLYAITCLNEDAPLPKTIFWQGNVPRRGAKIILLQTGKPLTWRAKEGGVEVSLPPKLQLAGDVKAVALSVEWQ